MNQEQLQNHLQELNRAVVSMSASESDKGKIVRLIADIEAQLMKPKLGEEPNDLGEQIDGLVTSFESEHPTVAGILNKVMLTLSSMGI